MMPSRKTRIIGSVTLASAVLAACGGGGGGGSFMPVSTPKPSASAQASPSASATPAATATASFTISVPVTIASTARHPLYVSPNTQSLAIALTDVNGTASTASPLVVKVGSGQQGCTAQVTGALTCTATMTVPAGSYDTFTISTYATQTGTGTPLSTTTVTQQFSANQTASVPFTLGGVVASIAMSPSVIHTVQGSGTSSYLVSVTALDASGNVILGGTLQSPISIAINDDPQHALLVSQTTILTPGTPVQVRYDGSKTLADGQIVASAGSLGSAKTDVIPLSFTPASLSAAMGAAAQPVTVSEVGFTGQFTASVDDTAVASETVTPAGSGTATVDVTPAALGGSSGSATLTVGDGTFTATIPITVTPPKLSGITYYPQSSSTFSPVGMAYDATNGLIYLTNLMGTIDEFNPATQTMNSYSVRTAEGFGSMHGITTDSSGNVWFVYDSSPPKICEMLTTTHAFSCYTAGLQTYSTLYQIAAGPDGGIWFTDAPFFGASPAIGRFDPTTDTSTEYMTGLPSSARPQGIVAGNNGNMYFSDTGSVPAFGSISTSTFAINEYTAGLTSNSIQAPSPYYLVLGADGNIWAADPGMTAIDEFVVSSNQTIMHFNGIERYGNPWGITTVPGSSDLWFTDASLFAPPLLGDVKLGGITQEYGGLPSTATNSINGIVATSPTDLWFFDQLGAAMGHATIP